MMTSYQLSSSCCVCGVVALCVRILVKIVLVSFTEMLVYRLVMSRVARLWCGSVAVFLRSLSRSWVFFMLKEWGRGANWFIFLVNSFDNLYAGELCQFTTGRMGWSVLCIFITPLMELITI